MRELLFDMEFLSDIVLHASSNTEGKIDRLDFVPGSSFLGMVAKNYDEFSDCFEIFHSGKVRFGDGHILKNGKITYKIPYSHVYKKLQSEPIYNHHKLEKEDFEKLGQLKQLRNGYIASNKEQVFVDYVYSQKSAYDKTKRRSMDSQMYGYSAIKKGSKWRFTVKMDDIKSDDEALLIKTLESSGRLGRSKSAEYGSVKITYLKNQKKENLNEKNPKLDEVVLYCNSRLALIDECGNPTYDLTHLCDGAEVVHEKTQIRTSTFTPYNNKRQTRDCERICVNKGSVIVLKNITKEQLEQIKNGVGAYLCEGFGEIIVNPSFLTEKEFKFAPKPSGEAKKDKRKRITENFENTAVQFLANRHNANIDMLAIADEIAVFVDTHKKSTLSNIKPSQWGNIRSIASSNQGDYIEKINSYIGSGSKKWEDSQVVTLMSAIENHKINKQNFTKLLAMKMGGKND